MTTPDLELRIGKFLFRFPGHLLYSPAGIWVGLSGRTARLGLSDFTQQRNGDVAFVEMRPAGTRVEAGGEIGIIETIKVNLSLPSPVTGTILEVNPELTASPELVNHDPFGKGWLAMIEVEGAVAGNLLGAAEFLDLARRQAEAEVSG